MTTPADHLKYAQSMAHEWAEEVKRWERIVASAQAEAARPPCDHARARLGVAYEWCPDCNAVRNFAAGEEWGQ